MKEPIIIIENLSKEFKLKNETVKALNNINLTINPGDIYGIIGLSGAGKSTLIRCMNLLEKPSSGNVYYDGMNLTKLKNKELLKVRQKIGMIFQNFNLLEQKTVLENVMFPLKIAKVSKEEAIKKAKELLIEVGLGEKFDAYPSQLSGGQKQRVAIARALANNPSVILCDEATSALDPNTTQQILSLLKEINKKYGITIIVITHEMKVIETLCNNVAIIDNGNLVEEGEVKEIFINPKTEVAKKLIIPQTELSENCKEKYQLRLIFDGNAEEAVIARMILHTKVLVNIINASFKTVDGKTYGELIINLAYDEQNIAKVKHYLVLNNISFSKED